MSQEDIIIIYIYFRAANMQVQVSESVSVLGRKKRNRNISTCMGCTGMQGTEWAPRTGDSIL